MIKASASEHGINIRANEPWLDTFLLQKLIALLLLFLNVFPGIGLGTPAQAIGQVTFTLSYVVVIVRGRLVSIGREYEDAAADLGAPPHDQLLRVLLPLLAPAIVASAAVVFALSIDDFVVTYYLSNDVSTETVPIKLYSAARAAPLPSLNALGSVMVILTLVALGFAYLLIKKVSKREEGTSIDTLGGMG